MIRWARPNLGPRVCQSKFVSQTGSIAVASAEQNGYWIITVSGEIDAHTAPTVREAVEAAIAPGAKVVADLGGVTFLDSTGLSVFVTALKHLREAGGTLDLVITSPRVLKVFSLTGLDGVIPIHEELSAVTGV